MTQAPVLPPRTPLDEDDEGTSGLRASLTTPVVLAVAALAAVLLAGGAYLTLSGGGTDPSAGTGTGAVVPAAPPVPAPTVTSAPPPPAGAGGAPARNPFVGAGAPAGGVAGPAGGSATPGADPVVQTVAAPAVTVTRTVAAPRATVTATPPPPVYLGLYGFTAAGDAQFRVNDDPGYTVAAGKVFAKTFKFVQKTGTNPVCAKVLYGDATTTVCEGTVKRVG